MDLDRGAEAWVNSASAIEAAVAHDWSERKRRLRVAAAPLVPDAGDWGDFNLRRGLALRLLAARIPGHAQGFACLLPRPDDSNWHLDMGSRHHTQEIWRARMYAPLCLAG